MLQDARNHRREGLRPDWSSDPGGVLPQQEAIISDGATRHHAIRRDFCSEGPANVSLSTGLLTGTR
jgi:hypothetical protein